MKFRLLGKEDFEDWLPLFDEKNVADFLGFDPALSPLQMCETWFEKIFFRYENGLGGMNVLVDKETERMVGQCGLLVQTLEGKQRLEIGYSILPEFWKRGFASEAARKCKEFAFQHDLWDSLISMVHIHNVGSEKVAVKNGMSLEKTIPEYKGSPVNIFRITKEEWLLQQML